MTTTTETLTATRDFRASQVIVVTTDARPASEGNVVARYNADHDVLTRTHYDGPRPTIKALRAAIAQVA